MIVNDAIAAATVKLQACSDTPALDAQVLMAHALGQGRTYILTHAREELATEAKVRFDQYIDQRSQGRPVAYITGTREFWSLPLNITDETLIPRPETELLVELALEKIPLEREISIADIGTGCGAIALAIASERPVARLLATDPSAAALRVARANAKRLHITNVEFQQGANLDPLSSREVDLIVTNPPYVPEKDLHLTRGDVRCEPRSALAAGEDGLEVIRTLVAAAGSHLVAGGWLMTEHGFDQEQVVADLFDRAGFRSIECYRDLADLPRVTIGQMPATEHE